MLVCELMHENPNVYRIRVPFPNVVTNETNCFVVVDGSDALVIDTGAPGSESARGLTEALERIGVDLREARFFLTHAHYDHAGLLPSVAPRGATVYVNARELPSLQPGFGKVLAAYSCRRFQEEGVSHAAACSASAAVVASTELDLSGYELFPVDEGDEIRVGRYVFKVVNTPGHTVGHMALREERSGICFTGDHVLFVITPGLAPRFGAGNALSAYIDSLRKISDLSCSRLFISHGECRLDFEDRIEHLIGHHERRCRSLEQVIAEADRATAPRGLTGYEIIRRIPWRIPAPLEECDELRRWSVYFQGIAMLDYLTQAGRIVRVGDEAPGQVVDDGSPCGAGRPAAASPASDGDALPSASGESESGAAVECPRFVNRYLLA